MIVVDASVLSVALADDGRDGAACRSIVAGEKLLAPELIDLEVLSVLRRQVMAGLLTSARAEAAVNDLAELPMNRVPHRRLLHRCWELRQTVTVYDAAYIALAEMFGVALVTGDARLSRAPGIRCQVEVVP